MAETIQLTPEQEAEFNRQTTSSPEDYQNRLKNFGISPDVAKLVAERPVPEAPAAAAIPANTVKLTAEQQAEYRKQTGTLDPIIDFSPEQIASLAKQDKTFDLISTFNQSRELYSDPAIAQKAADAHNLIKQQTSVLEGVSEAVSHPLRTAGTAISTTADIFKNMGRILFRTIKEAPTAAFGAVAEKLDVLAGVDPEKTAEVRREAQRKIVETWAGIESSTSGLAMQAARAPGKIGRALGISKSLDKFTPQEKLDDFFKSVGQGEALTAAVRGKGEFLTAIGGDVIKELEATGHPVDPVVASELASGDPFVWWAFGKAFHAPGKLLPRVSVPAAVGDAAAQVGGRTIEGLGNAARATAAGVSKAAPLAAPAGLVTGLVKGGPVGALAGLKGGEIAARTIKKGAEIVEKTGSRAAEAGKQIAGITPITLPVAQVARDVLQTLPSAAGEVAKGAALDIGLAALTAETPADLEHMISVGTALGAVGAGRRIGGRVISGQLIAPRAWGSRAPVASSGQYPSLDALHSTSLRDAPPGVSERLNAMRQFVSGTADVFYGKDSASIEKALTDAGVNPQTAKLFSEQEGFFTVDLPGRDGNSHRVIVAKNIDAAPHESFHAFQDVLGEGANRGIDEVMRRIYAPEWENLGQSYARRLGGSGENWRDTVLESSGWGRAEAIEKIVAEIENNYLQKTGSPAPEGYAERMAAEQWKRALSEIKAQNPDISAADLQREAWRGILDERETAAVADRYLARELAAENFDAAFKHLGPSLAEQKGIVPWFARIIAKTSGLMGAEPLAGRTSEIGQIPLRVEAVEAVTGAVPKVEPTTATQTPAVQPRVAAPKQIVPATPEAKQAAVDEAKQIAGTAPETISAGGTKSTRELLGEIAESIAQQVGVKLNYLSAKDEPAASITSNRKSRRAMIEVFRTMPASARALWEKNFFPERIIRTGQGKIQVLGWAPEVFAANAHKTAQALSGKPELSPYAIDPKTGTFTPEAWQQLYEDAQTFVRNQMGGRTGAGEPLVVPGPMVEAGFFKPPVSGTAAPLEQRKSDFINLLFNFRLPSTPRITQGKTPLNIAGQEISAATKPGRLSVPVERRAPFGGPAAEKLGIAGREILEVNPLRAEIEQAGVKLPELIESIQRLNAESIREVQAAPEQPQFRGNTLTLSAGFQPKPSNPRAIKEAAVKAGDGKVFTGLFHSEAFEKAMRASGVRNSAETSSQYQKFAKEITDGFVDNSGEFLDREAALKRAIELKQLDEKDYQNELSKNDLGDDLNYLETGIFEDKRQFQPVAESELLKLRPGQRRIEIVGPDGKIYPARFDGYQEVPGQKPIVQVTPEGGLPWQGNSTRSTTYESTLTDRGFKIKNRESLPTMNEWLDERNQASAMFQPKPDEPKAIKAAAIRDRETGKIWEGTTHVDAYHAAENKGEDPSFGEFGFVSNSGEFLDRETAYNRAISLRQVAPDSETAQTRVEGGLEADIFSQERQFQPKREEFEKALNSALVKPGWAILTATREKLGPGTAKVNQDANKRLADELTESGYEIIPVSGAYKGEDQGQNFLVLGITPEEASALGNKYSQESVMVPEGLLYEDGTIIPAKPDEITIGDNARKQDFYSTLPNGTSFSIPLDFSAERIKPIKSDDIKKIQFAPKKDDYKFRKSQSGFSKAWIAPDGKPIQLGGQWHHEWVNENPDTAKKYGLNTTDSAETNRNEALRAGFARINLDKRSGLLTIEARAADWRKLKPSITDLIDKNLDDIDRVSVFLMNNDVTKVADSAGESLFNFDTDAEKMQNLPFITKGEIRGQFQPRAEQEQLFGGREMLSSVELSNMTKKEIADYFPEAVIPQTRDEKIPSEITRSPLYKTSADPVSAFADKLVEFANEWKSDPAFKHGSRWYSEFTPMLKREFGADAQLMAELLAATSPKTPPNTNFGYALDALEGFKSGRFKKTIDKFNQGMEMLAEDRWLSWYNRELKAGNIPSPPAEPTPAAFLEHWIATHDLKPRQSNGKLYGQHSLPVLQVFARRWMRDNTGPKTRNFVENLLGTGYEATIDLWADRTMRRLGYAGKERWRILPQNGTGVSDEDFSFAQKAFRAAAERLRMKPADLQGALWFAEKSLWADNGWGRLDLGDFRAEMEKLPLLRRGIQHRLARGEAVEKSKPAEQELLKVEPK